MSFKIKTALTDGVLFPSLVLSVKKFSENYSLGHMDTSIHMTLVCALGRNRTYITSSASLRPIH